MKRIATVTETMFYIIEFEVEDSATDDQIEEAAREEWGANPGREPHDYACKINVDLPTDQARPC